jgi:hypothetical protein
MPRSSNPWEPSLEEVLAAVGPLPGEWEIAKVELPRLTRRNITKTWGAIVTLVHPDWSMPIELRATAPRYWGLGETKACSALRADLVEIVRDIEMSLSTRKRALKRVDEIDRWFAEHFPNEELEPVGGRLFPNLHDRIYEANLARLQEDLERPDAD